MDRRLYVQILNLRQCKSQKETEQNNQPNKQKTTFTTIEEKVRAHTTSRGIPSM